MVTPFRPGSSQVKGLFQPDLMSENMFFGYVRTVSGMFLEARKNCPRPIGSENFATVTYEIRSQKQNHRQGHFH